MSCFGALRRDARTCTDKIEYATHPRDTAGLNDKAVQPFRSRFLDKPGSPTYQSAPDVKCSAYPYRDWDAKVTMLPNPLFLNPSAHSDKEQVDVFAADVLDHACFLVRIKVARVKSNELQRWEPGFHVSGSTFDNVRPCADEVDVEALALSKV